MYLYQININLDATMYRSMYNVTTLLEEPESDMENEDKNIEENYRMDMIETSPDVVENTQHIEEPCLQDNNNEAPEIIPDSQRPSLENEIRSDDQDKIPEGSSQESIGANNSVPHDERPFVHMFIPFNDKPRKNQKRYSKQNSNQKKEKKETEKQTNSETTEIKSQKIENSLKEGKTDIEKSNSEKLQKNLKNKSKEEVQSQNKLQSTDNESNSKKTTKTNIDKISVDAEKDRQKVNSKRNSHKPGAKNKELARKKPEESKAASPKLQMTKNKGKIYLISFSIFIQVTLNVNQENS